MDRIRQHCAKKIIIKTGRNDGQTWTYDREGSAEHLLGMEGNSLLRVAP